GTTSVSDFASLTMPGSANYTGMVSVTGGGSLSVGTGTVLPTATVAAAVPTTNTFSAGVNAVTTIGNLLFAGNNTFGGPTTLSTAVGTLSLPGNNSFTGNLVLNAPGAASGVVPMGGTNTYTGGITLNGGNFVMTGSNTGFTSLTLNNGATVTLGTAAGANPAGTPLTLNGAGATVVMNESQTWGSLTGALDTRILVAAGKVFTSTDSSASPITLATNIAGAGSFTKAGSADMNIVAPQSFQGTFTIGGGTVSLLPSPQFANVNGLIGDKAAVVIQSGALNLNGRSETIGSLEGAGNVLLRADGQLTVGGNNLTPAGALSGNILGSGSAGLTKVGGGTLTLSGTNTFPGALNILGGGLVLANPAGGTLNSAVKADLSLPGASLTVNSDQALAGLTGAGGSSVAIGSGATLTVNYVDSAPITAKATLAAGSRELVNFGEPYTTDLTAGMKITLGSGILIPSFVVQVLGAGRTGGAGVLINNATKDPASDTFGFVKVGVLNSALTGQGDFNKTGSGTLIMTGKNTNSGYTGIANGTLMLGGIAVNGEYIFQNILSDQSELRFGTTGTPTLNLADNTLNLQPYERVGSLSGGNANGTSAVINLVNNLVVNTTGVITQANVGSLVFGGDNKSTSFSGQINADHPASFLMKEGDGTFTLHTIASVINGTVRVDGGVLNVPDMNGLNNGSATTLHLELSNKQGAAFQAGIATTLPYISGGAGVTDSFRNGVTGALQGNYKKVNGMTVDGGNIILPNNANFNFVVNSNTATQITRYSGSISGAGGFVKSGAHTLILYGNNTYTGQTLLTTGTLQLGFLSEAAGLDGLTGTDRMGKLPIATAVDLSGASLLTNNIDQTIKNLTSQSASSLVEIGRSTLSLNQAADTFVGTIVSAASSYGTGSGLRNIGQVQINDGAWRLGNTGAITGPSLSIFGHYDDINNQPTGVVTLGDAGTLASTTWVTVGSGGMLKFDNNSEDRIGSLQGVGTVDLGAAHTLVITSPGGLSQGVFSGNIIGGPSGKLVVDGAGTLILSGANTYQGGTEIRGGGSILLNTAASTGSSDILPTFGVTLEQGALRISGAQTEALGGITLNRGMNLVRRELGSTAGVDLGTITALGGALILQKDLATTSTLNGAAGILGAYGVVGGTGWATVDGTGLITELAAANYAGASEFAAGNAAGLNVKVNANVLAKDTAATLTFNSGAHTVKLRETVSLTEGGILVTRNALSTESVIAANLNAGGDTPSGDTPSLLTSIAQGPGGAFVNLFVHQFNELAPLNISVPIVDPPQSPFNGNTPLAFTKTGPGTLILTGENTFTGAVVIGDGTLQVGNGTGVGTLGFDGITGEMANYGVLAVNLSNDVNKFLDISRTVSGTGMLRKLDASRLYLNTANTFTGRVSVQAGTLFSTKNASLGSPDGLTAVESGATLDLYSTNSLEPIFLKGGTLRADISGAVLNGVLTLAANSVVRGPGDVTLHAPVLAPVTTATGTSVTFNLSGDNNNVTLTNVNQLGNIVVGGGSLIMGNLTPDNVTL
ncbi:MAG: uncharacterized protein JWO89_3844, partial [Verrucomicrobiaceae bacterium]|nr:uncharacterized protein [Verrucomicrobiaceae bacterium]